MSEFALNQLSKDWEIIIKHLVKPQASYLLNKGDLVWYVWSPQKSKEDAVTTLKVDELTGEKTIELYVRESVLREKFACCIVSPVPEIREISRNSGFFQNHPGIFPKSGINIGGRSTCIWVL